MVKVTLFVKVSADENADRTTDEMFDVGIGGINGYEVESYKISSAERVEEENPQKKSESPQFPSLNPSPPKFAVN